MLIGDMQLQAELREGELDIRSELQRPDAPKRPERMVIKLVGSAINLMNT